MFNAVEVSERGLRLAVSCERLVISKEDLTVLSVPLTEVDALVVSEPAVSLTGVLLAQMAEKRIPVIVCDRKYLPSAALCPVIRDGGEFHSMLPLQVDSSGFWKAKVWKKLIVSKIRGQHKNLLREKKSSHLNTMADKVQDGDIHNVEARAAAAYWSALNLFPVRDRFAPDANLFFNYAYAILYAAFARAVCAAAFLPHIGIHHHGKYNPFSLASDLMEPFRPYADRAVFAFLKNHPQISELTKENRLDLIREIYAVVLCWNGRTQTMLDTVPDFVLSFKKSMIAKSSRILSLPKDA